MIKKISKKERLTDLLGVLLFLIQCSEDNEERNFLEDFAIQTENKIKEIDK